MDYIDEQIKEKLEQHYRGMIEAALDAIKLIVKYDIINVTYKECIRHAALHPDDKWMWLPNPDEDEDEDEDDRVLVGLTVIGDYFLIRATSDSGKIDFTIPVSKLLELKEKRL